MRSEVRTILDILDFDEAFAKYTITELMSIFECSDTMIRESSKEFYNRKRQRKRIISEIKTPEHLIQEEELKCVGAWMESKERKYIKQLI